MYRFIGPDVGKQKPAAGVTLNLNSDRARDRQPYFQGCASTEERFPGKKCKHIFNISRNVGKGHPGHAPGGDPNLFCGKGLGAPMYSDI